MARKRKPGPRSPSGRLSRAYRGPARDTGTPEAQAHRLAMVNGSRNDSLAHTLPDILVAHGIVTPAQHAAAWRLRKARAAVFGVPLQNSVAGREADDQRVHENERRYERLIKLLTPDQALAVVDLALDLRPGWIRRAIFKIPPVAGDATDRAALISGLDVLAGA